MLHNCKCVAVQMRIEYYIIQVNCSIFYFTHRAYRIFVHLIWNFEILLEFMKPNECVNWHSQCALYIAHRTLMYKSINRSTCKRIQKMQSYNILYILHIKLCAYLFVMRESSWKVNQRLWGILHWMTFCSLFYGRNGHPTIIVHLLLFVQLFCVCKCFSRIFSLLCQSLPLPFLSVCVWLCIFIAPLACCIILQKLICVIFPICSCRVCAIFRLAKSDGKYGIDSYECFNVRIHIRMYIVSWTKHRMKWKSFSPNYKRSWIQSRQQL